MKELDECPIVGILRGIEPQHLKPLANVSMEAGLKMLEVTMNTSGASAMIQNLKAHIGAKMKIGAGTVTNLSELDMALNAGAEFVVMPAIVKDVIEKCVRLNVPVFPGALTPSEILMAWEMGATMVKVFPASVFGPRYLKDIKGPFNKLKLMAVGGVSSENIFDFFANGASAVAFGASIFQSNLLGLGNYVKIKNMISELIAGYNTWKTANR